MAPRQTGRYDAGVRRRGGPDAIPAEGAFVARRGGVLVAVVAFLFALAGLARSKFEPAALRNERGATRRDAISNPRGPACRT